MLKRIYLTYLRSLLIFSVVIAAIYIALYYCANELVSHNTPYLILAFLAVTAGTHFAIIKMDVERLEYKPDSQLSKELQTKEMVSIERRFITRYMLTTTVKLFTFLLLLGLYAYFNREDIVLFSINFLAIYVLYAIFEMISIKKPIK